MSGFDANCFAAIIMEVVCTMDWMKVSSWMHLTDTQLNAQQIKIIVVSKTTPETAVTLYAIKKFLDSKQSELSNNPETKLMIKCLTESGHLLKIDGKFADGKNSPKHKQHPAQKRKSGSESKNLAKGSGYSFSRKIVK
ncbi:hypothetical protein AVEN_132108-1 [Araneus ventricosus]|uniref:Uncharacterized protein n=1 Tax=Araneus ventricosus TaxID=182803 RepID=A0A4Y2KSF2_ARAVE|nr:hypothetical protein AVEN_132108-1 [Araneus ventricosus]